MADRVTRTRLLCLRHIWSLLLVKSPWRARGSVSSVSCFSFIKLPRANSFIPSKGLTPSVSVRKTKTLNFFIASHQFYWRQTRKLRDEVHLEENTAKLLIRFEMYFLWWTLCGLLHHSIGSHHAQLLAIMETGSTEMQLHILRFTK